MHGYVHISKSIYVFVKGIERYDLSEKFLIRKRLIIQHTNVAIYSLAAHIQIQLHLRIKHHRPNQMFILKLLS